MDLLLFCEWLIHLEVFEDEFGAGMTVDGIRNYCHQSAMKAIKDGDKEEFRKYVNICDNISLMRDRARVAKDERKFESLVLSD